MLCYVRGAFKIKYWKKLRLLTEQGGGGKGSAELCFMKQCTSVINLDDLLCNMTCFKVIPNYHVNGHVVM